MNKEIPKLFDRFSHTRAKIILLEGNKCVRKIDLTTKESREFIIGRIESEEDNKALKDIYQPLLDGHLCGYVAIHKDSVPKAWHGDYDAVPYDLNIQGGLTYASMVGDYAIFGFDCNHFNDSKDERLKDPEFVMGLVKEMESELLTKAKEMMG